MSGSGTANQSERRSRVTSVPSWHKLSSAKHKTSRDKLAWRLCSLRKDVHSDEPRPGRESLFEPTAVVASRLDTDGSGNGRGITGPQLEELRLPLGVVPARGQRTDSIITKESNDTEPQRPGIGWEHG